jgi:DNA (cytosine-5)-methyltransferase 1
VSERCDSWKKIATFNTNPNPNSNGLNKCNSDNEINTSKGGVNALGNTNESNGDGDSSNTNSTNSQTRTQREILGQSDWEKTNGHSNVERRNQWKNFPTVSPVHYGDDGISDRLDSITFPKWRNESIKAGGNAIVPQVVYQIFKAIEQYERINTPDKNK